MLNKINPSVYIIPPSSAGYDITAVTAEIEDGLTALRGSVGAIQIDSALTDKFKLLLDGFAGEAVNGALNNLRNPRKTQKLSFVVPIPNGVGATEIALRASMIALNSGATYDVYVVDPYTGSTGYVSKYSRAKVMVDPSKTPDGGIYTITVETQNMDNYFQRELPINYVAP